MSKKMFFTVSLASVIVLIFIMNLTTPSEIGPLGVLVFFTLFYLICLGIVTLLCGAFFFLMKKMKNEKFKKIEKKSYYYGSILAFVPVVLIFLRSSGGIGLLELGLVTLFAVVGCFYVSKRIQA